MYGMLLSICTQDPVQSYHMLNGPNMLLVVLTQHFETRFERRLNWLRRAALGSEMDRNMSLRAWRRWNIKGKQHQY